MHPFHDLPLERSDDLMRGVQPHLVRAVSQVRRLHGGSTPCADCRALPATHVVDTQGTPRAVCTTCAEGWRRATLPQRAARRAAFERRGRL